MFSFEGIYALREKSGDKGEEEPPVPIPNTEVKLFSVEDTWWVTARENRTLPEPKIRSNSDFWYIFLVAISVGRATAADTTWEKKDNPD